MGLFDRFRRKKQEEIQEQDINQQYSIIDEPEIILEDSSEIIKITNDEILDTTDKESIAKFKHNLKTLYKRLEETKEIDKFVIIRDDDFFPFDDKWTVASKETTLEETNLALSSRLRERIAKKQSGLNKKVGNIPIPPTEDEMRDALKKVDRNIASILMPAHFRSTKHFTINTPLGATGDYNGVSSERNFTIIDTMDNFLNSGYAYSIAPHDAYLDVTHEPLVLSNQAIVLINEEKYVKLKENQELMNALQNKKVIRYKGSETIAVDMILTELGIIPTRVGMSYYEDSKGIAKTKTEEKLKEIAQEKEIAYDQSHGGEKNGHFTSYYDDMNPDWDYAINRLENFLKEKYPNIPISSFSITKTSTADQLIDAVGEESLVTTIKEYNEIIKEETKKARKKHVENRENLPKDVSDIFKKTIRRIEMFYKNNEKINYTTFELRELEENIRLFFQATTVDEQLKKASIILKTMKKEKNNELNRMLNDEEIQSLEERNYKI